MDSVKGFNDFTREDAVKRSEIKKILVSMFERFGFEPAETPLIEYEEFVRGDNTNDEAVSDIFKLQDKGKRKLALRYEFTFQLKRLMNNKKLPYKRYQIGPVFRDEPVSSNRLRQFIQCDADIIGSCIKDEAEILALANEILLKLGIEPIILINNRKLLNEILDSEGIKDKDKLNVLREIDKIDKLSEAEVKKNLKKYRAENIIDSLKKGEKFFNQFSSYKEIISLMEYCKLYGIKVLFSPSVIRGLSYYNGNVFEIKTKGIKETICAGGSYMFNNVQSTGISLGLDRISSLMKSELKREKILVISLDQDKKAIELVQKLRKQEKIVQVYYGKPSKALEYANSYNFQQVIFLGSEEIKKKKYKIKDMKSGKERFEKL